MMKAVNVFFILLFIISAGLQYNDPDPYIWIPLYLYGAVICYLAVKGRIIPAMYVAGALVYFGYAAFLMVDDDGVLSWWNEHDAENIVQSMHATKPWIEETREFFGLILLLFALGINWFFNVRRTRRSLSEKTREVVHPAQ
jgi:hypothetical protein